jgi:very-short-patch-repair endonuclease
MALERQGWQIHRIWSTDWFKNRNAEIDRLMKRVRALEMQ